MADVVWNLVFEDEMGWEDGSDDREMVFGLPPCPPERDPELKPRFLTVYVPEPDWRILGCPSRIRVTVSADG